MTDVRDFLAEYVAATQTVRRAKRMSLDQGDRWRADPVAWVHDRCEVTMHRAQRDVLRAVRDHSRVAVKAGHAVGKTHMAAHAAAWWIDVHPYRESMVITTAPTGHQVKNLLWKEIRRAHRAADLPGRTNQTEWHLDDEIVAFGRKPADYDPTSFQGYHAPYILVILDEACGIPKALWDAADSLASSDTGHILAIGNPDDPNTHFHTVTELPTWHVKTISCFDTPAYTGEQVPDIALRSLVSPRWVEEKRIEWGEDSGLWHSKVIGEFPSSAVEGVIGRTWIDASRAEHRPGTRRIGLDVAAGGGDRTVAWLMDGNQAVASHSWNDDDPIRLAQQVALWADEVHATSIKTDVIGVGWGVHGALNDLYNRGQLRAYPSGFHAAERATDHEKFANAKAEAWWMLRMRAQEGTLDLAALDEQTVEELTQHKWTTNAAGRIVIEKKDDVRKRIGRSPDHADALIMAALPASTPARTAVDTLMAGRIK